ncbi:hypothetical protein P153DRAFT_344776 [Dothidotthia symphoricarpi CBS 119687]|uniref:Uncharacterized protein n=1 Tax=Dothidotthia symphoricarpi CBS 119687 TaxID=1392245 RepID=A0A6A6A8X6_9PLEO|nr:uncharacterized protein P153DRAFT_344776 [Dothidotthia symphoricarpi CBS 119687]KAF2127278.1 hypothetical protein P153DRAFT_344776 [Dothidotthia symphoricarpi CBS 119687]
MQHHHHNHMHHHARRHAHADVPSTGSRTLMENATRALAARAASTCTNDSDAGCTKPTQTPTLAIVLAIAVPVCGMAVVMFFLHRRHQKKQREEDIKDKYKSLDFGVEPKAGGIVGAKKGPEMSIKDIEKELQQAHGRGISLEHGSPYILPVGLHGSQESLHSLSRSTHDPHDPYNPVTFMNDGQSMRSGNRAYGRDNGSLYTTSSTGTDGLGLLKNAQRMSHSPAMRGQSLSPDGTRSPELQFPDPTAVALSPLNPRFEERTSPSSGLPVTSLDTRNPVPTITFPEVTATDKQVSKSPVQTTNPYFPPARIQSQQAILHENGNTTSIISTSSYGDAFQVTPPSPRQSTSKITEEKGPLSPAPLRPQHSGPQSNGLAVDESAGNTNRLSMSLRPMPPPSDDPEENPEQRANRIRSFYKEYFDDSKPEPAGGHVYTDYVEDYGSEYLDGTVFDPQSKAFVVSRPNAPFAEPVTRRAMTPPPRAPPRFRSNTGTLTPNGPGSPMSSPRNFPPRNMSSMSGQMAAPTPRKPMPPPAALSSLPTPAKLTENSMVFNANDFAPPVSYRDRQNGMRPDSPLGAPRPFSPAVRPHTPLVGSYDDLPVMPSPHLLRQSSTFTALDFAPPPRFQNEGSRDSDAGSIRSNRSGMSATGRFAVRSGANRVSRIPKEMVTTREDLASQLRPQMSLVSKA